MNGKKVDDGLIQLFKKSGVILKNNNYGPSKPCFN